MTDVGLEAEPEANTQARSALRCQTKRMFEVAIELVNERGTAKTTLKDIGERAATAVVWRAIGLAQDGLWMELFARFDDIWKAHLSQHLSGKVRLCASSGHSGAAGYFYA